MIDLVLFAQSSDEKSISPNVFAIALVVLTGVALLVAYLRLRRREERHS